MAEAARICLLCVVAAVTYGLVHDQVTARVCLEYFTVGHPRAFVNDSPTMHALYWGVVATWWVGLIAGVALAAASRAGRWPKRTARSLVWPLAIVLALNGTAALVAGRLGYRLATQGSAPLPTFLADRIPPDRHAAFVGVAFAHNASYLLGALLVLTLTLIVIVRRAVAADRLARDGP